MGQILPKLTEGEHDFFFFFKAGLEKKVLILGVRGASV